MSVYGNTIRFHKPKEPEHPYLEFYSDTEFAIAVGNRKWDGMMEYSTNAETWTEWPKSNVMRIYSANKQLFLRGTGNSVVSYDLNGRFQFEGATNLRVIGNIENLLDCQTVQQGNHPTMGAQCFRYMFYNASSMSVAPTLPALNVPERGYASMFLGTGIHQAPALPADTLANGCYNAMFQNCVNLVDVPSILPSAIIPANGYASMFQGCSSLVTPPYIAATILEALYYPESGYVSGGNCASMFYGCSSLTRVAIPPAHEVSGLPATSSWTYINDCYNSMYRGCSSIKVSETQTAECPYPLRIPPSGTFQPVTNTGYAYNGALEAMFYETGGFTNDLKPNVTYYINNPLVTA